MDNGVGEAEAELLRARVAIVGFIGIRVRGATWSTTAYKEIYIATA